MTSSVPNVLAARYASEAMVGLWSASHKVVLERRLWIAVLRAQDELGVEVPAGVVDAYEAVVDQVDECWFTVKGDNVAARTLHAFLGAREVERRRDYYGIGEDRIVSCVDRKDFDRLRERYHRLRGAAGEPVMERPSPSVAA